MTDDYLVHSLYVDDLNDKDDRIAQLEAALQSIICASDSNEASGGEMFWAAAVAPAIEKAKSILSTSSSAADTKMLAKSIYDVLITWDNHNQNPTVYVADLVAKVAKGLLSPEMASDLLARNI